jgi:hypothetical protein
VRRRGACDTPAWIRRGLCAAAMLLVAATAVAQSSQGRVEVSGGARWIGQTRYPTVSADQTTSGGGTRALFDTRTSLDQSIGPVGTIGLHLSRALTVEAAFAFSPTGLTTRITGDVEGVPDVTVGTQVRQFLVEGGVVARPDRWRSGPLRPYVTGGVGYVRQLYDGRTLLATGRAYYVGGGLYYERSSTRPSALKATGIRVDVRALVLTDGVAPDSGGRPAPAVTAALFARF